MYWKNWKQKQYDKGFENGYEDGFKSGSQKALHEFRKVLVKQIQSMPEYADNQQTLLKVISTIRKGK